MTIIKYYAGFNAGKFMIFLFIESISKCVVDV